MMRCPICGCEVIRTEGGDWEHTDVGRWQHDATPTAVDQAAELVEQLTRERNRATGPGERRRLTRELLRAQRALARAQGSRL